MHGIARVRVFVALVLCGLVASGCFHTTTAIDDAVMSQKIDKSSSAPTQKSDKFKKTDRVYCCVHVTNLERGKNTVSLKWHYKTETLDTTFEADKSGSGWIRFELPLALGTAPAGDYAVDVSLDGKLARTLKFTVSGAPKL